MSEPCALQRAIALADAPRTVIRLKSGVYGVPDGILIDKELTLFGRDAVIDRNGTDGPTLSVESFAKLGLYYLTIMGGSGLGGHGIRGDGEVTLSAFNVTIRSNQGQGIQWFAGPLTLVNSKIQQNSGGGIHLRTQSRLEIVGNLLWRNGSESSAIGGINVSSISALDRIEFNTFSFNEAIEGLGSAIECISPLTARNNILSGNGTVTNMEQIGGTCKHAYSIVRPGSLPEGPGNSSADPLFIDRTGGDLHIMNGSPAKGAADPASDLTGIAAFDIDGDARTSPADIGADEVP